MDSVKTENKSSSYWLVICYNYKGDPTFTNIYQTLDEAIMAAINETDGQLYRTKDETIWYDTRLSGRRSATTKGCIIKLSNLKERVKKTKCFAPSDYSEVDYDECIYKFKEVYIGSPSPKIETVRKDRCTYCHKEIAKVEDTNDYLLYTCQDCRFDCSDCGIKDVPKKMGRKCKQCEKLICESHFIPHVKRCGQDDKQINQTVPTVKYSSNPASAPKEIQLHVHHYPNNFNIQGMLFRSAEGIILNSQNGEPIAIGSDLKNNGIIKLMNDQQRQQLQKWGAKIDESWRVGSTKTEISARNYIQQYRN